MKPLLFITALLIFASCSDLKKSDQLEQVDALINTLAENEQLLVENELKPKDEMLVKMNELVTDLKHFESDTITLETAIMFDSYKRAQENITLLLGLSNELKSAVGVQKEVLIQLRDDINKGSGKRNKYDSYISFEKEKVDEILAAIEDYMTLKEEITETYTNLHNDLSAIVVNRTTVQEQ